jgi:hypothetical protein
MDDRTDWPRPPTTQYTNRKKYRFDRLTSTSDIRSFSTSTLMMEIEESYETWNLSAKLTWLIAREDFITFTHYATRFHSKCTTALFVYLLIYAYAGLMAFLL